MVTDEMQKEGKSWKDKLRSMLREIISYSRSFEKFLKNCTASGIEYVYTPQNKVKLKFKLSGEGQQRFTRADTLGDEFELENIKATIERALIKERIQNRFGKYFASPKTEPTPTATAPTKPIATPPTTPKTNSDKVVLTDDEFLALLDEKSAEVTPAPKPTESKPPEKKEDVWASIRGMGKLMKLSQPLKLSALLHLPSSQALCLTASTKVTIQTSCRSESTYQYR